MGWYKFFGFAGYVYNTEYRIYCGLESERDSDQLVTIQNEEGMMISTGEVKWANNYVSSFSIINNGFSLVSAVDKVVNIFYLNAHYSALYYPCVDGMFEQSLYCIIPNMKGVIKYVENDLSVRGLEVDVVNVDHPFDNVKGQEIPVILNLYYKDYTCGDHCLAVNMLKTVENMRIKRVIGTMYIAIDISKSEWLILALARMITILNMDWKLMAVKGKTTVVIVQLQNVRRFDKEINILMRSKNEDRAFEDESELVVRESMINICKELQDLIATIRVHKTHCKECEEYILEYRPWVYKDKIIFYCHGQQVKSVEYGLLTNVTTIEIKNIDVEEIDLSDNEYGRSYKRNFSTVIVTGTNIIEVYVKRSSKGNIVGEREVVDEIREVLKVNSRCGKLPIIGVYVTFNVEIQQFVEALLTIATQVRIESKIDAENITESSNKKRSPLCLDSINGKKLRFKPEVNDKCRLYNAMVEVREVWRNTTMAIRSSLDVECRRVAALRYEVGVKHFDGFDTTTRATNGLSTSDVSFGVIDIVSNRWLVVPYEIRSAYEQVLLYEDRDFQSMFYFAKDLIKDSKLIYRKGVDLKLDELIKRYPRAAVSDKCRVMNDDRLYRAVSFSSVIPQDLNFEITIIEGVPGAGKTENILRRHEYNNASHYVITTTREAAQDIRKRVVERYYKNYIGILDKNIRDMDTEEKYLYKSLIERYRTCESFIINYKCDTAISVLWIDEALMKHFGEVGWAAYKAGVKKIMVYGDGAQIPYYNREGFITCKHDIYKRMNIDKEYLHTSYRCPMDVMYALASMKSSNGENFYSGVLINTVSNVERSVRSKYVPTISSIPDDERRKQVLTFTQNERRS
uniref:Rna replicase n=1 Tax=Triatoma infestans TaxID=30076 RepID=A0A161MGA5_TRIIF